MKTILILGATSDVGMACAEVYASKQYKVQLAARSSERLQPLVSDLQIRYNTVIEHYDFDAEQFDTHQRFFDSLSEKPAVVLCLFGYLGDQEKAEKDFSETQRIITANYTGAVSILNIVAAYFVERGQGAIIGVSSVAGERGRMSNYTYGSAKAGFTAYLSGLRNRLFHKGVHVVTVKPGFMDTRMTEGLNLPKPLTAQPAEAAKAIYRAYRRRKNVVYVKGIWAFIMLVIRNIPEFIFKRMKL